MTAVLDEDYVESVVPDLSRYTLAEAAALDVAQDHAVIEQTTPHPELDRQEQQN